jgi:hypothetical protein
MRDTLFVIASHEQALIDLRRPKPHGYRARFAPERPLKLGYGTVEIATDFVAGFGFEIVG